MSYEKLIQDGESHLRAGNLQEVARQLSALKPAQVPRDWRRPLASLCRRSNLLTMGLKLLSPIVRSADKGALLRPQATEVAEYGALLYRLGAIPEAVRLLETVDVREAPEALLYQAFCYFNQWEYAEALPLLETYLLAPLSRYARLVGCVNICAALVGTRRWEAARELLNANIAFTHHEGYWRLNSNCLELSAQVYLHQGLFDKAHKDLKEAERLLKDNQSNDLLYVHKWQAILNAHQSGSSGAIFKFAAQAARRQEWESVREADLFALKIDFDEARFEYLIFGTPFVPYREKIMHELGHKPAKASYILGGGAPGRILDLNPAAVGQDSFKPSVGIHRVVEVLARDFYRPMSLGGFFSAMFPGEYFDIYSSPARLHQLLRRTRAWLRENEIPARIQSTKAGYRLHVDGDFGFRVPYERTRLSHYELQWKNLTAHFRGANFFTANEARTRLGLPPTSFKRLMKWAMEKSLVERRGGGSNVIYRIVAGSKSEPNAA